MCTPEANAVRNNLTKTHHLINVYRYREMGLIDDLYDFSSKYTKELCSLWTEHPLPKKNWQYQI